MRSRAAGAASAGAAVGRTAVTTARCGPASAGRSAAETAFAPDLDRGFGASPDARIRVRGRERQRALEDSLARSRRGDHLTVKYVKHLGAGCHLGAGKLGRVVEREDRERLLMEADLVTGVSSSRTR